MIKLVQRKKNSIEIQNVKKKKFEMWNWNNFCFFNRSM